MKLSLPGLGGITGLLLAHGEKLLIAVVGVCVAMLVFRSLGRESLPDNRQADVLQREINQARSDVEGYTFDRAKTEFPDQVMLVQPLETKGESLVDVAKYRTDSWQYGWNRPVVPPIVRRSDPVLLEVVDVEATGGSGLLAFTNPDIRRAREVEARLKEQQRAAQQQKQQEQQTREEQRGRGGRGGRGGLEPGGEEIDPEHPNRRPVGSGMGRGIGAQLVGDEEVRVAHWAVVVAKVPIKEQLKRYQDAFANALGYQPQADVPQYLGYFVERAEVRPGVEDKDLQWQKVTVTNGKGQAFGKAVSEQTLYGRPADAASTTAPKAGVVTDWATGAQMPEVVDPRYLDGRGLLAFPLPPLVGREWGSEVTHSEIPLAIDAVETAPGATPAPATPETPADEESVDVFAGGAATAAGVPGRQAGGYGGGRGEYLEGGYGRAPYGGRMMEGYGGYGAEAYMGGSGRGGLGADFAPQADFWLLRFFDFTVQPGRKYKYRVQLVLLDPNQSFGQRFVSIDMLDKDAMARVKAEKAARQGEPPRTPFRLTDWSEPSRTVSVPQAGSVRVAAVRAANEQSYVDEPRATLLVESFAERDQGKFVQAAKEFEFRRGYVANKKDKAEVLVEGGRFIDEIPDYQFITGITAVDIRGGERLPGRGNQRPGRVLLMDPAGQLYIQNQLDDAEAIEMHKAIFEEEPTDGGFRGEQFFEGGRGGYGGRGFPGTRGG